VIRPINPSRPSSSGNFVVVWNSGAGHDGYAYGVFGQRFSQNVPVQLVRFGVE
jgi:hypothetical protein